MTVFPVVLPRAPPSAVAFQTLPRDMSFPKTRAESWSDRYDFVWSPAAPDAALTTAAPADATVSDIPPPSPMPQPVQPLDVHRAAVRPLSADAGGGGRVAQQQQQQQQQQQEHTAVGRSGPTQPASPRRVLGCVL